MKIKTICAVVALTLLISIAPASAVEYDPINTMSAINMAIVSIHRIASSRDRVVLDAEYKNIIDNLSMGNIEDDSELRELYKELMATIAGKALREDEAARVDAKYAAREKKNFVNRLAGARFLSGNPWSFIGGLLSGEAVQYFGAATLYSSDERDAADDELWRLERENLEDLASLQRRLLDSSWTLLRKYSLPDEYRLSTQDLDALDMAISESDPERSLRMFKALEPHFKMYAPFWYYYSTAASRAGDMPLASRCLDEFERVWRPVLRRDPFRAEVAKLRASELSNAGAPKEAVASQLEIVMGNSSRENWVNNLFAGVTYYSIGETERAVECAQINVDFGAEREISGEVIRNMRAGNLDVELFSDAVMSTLIAAERGYGTYGGGGAAERSLIALFKDDAIKAVNILSDTLEDYARTTDPLPYHVLSNIIGGSRQRLNHYASSLPDIKALAGSYAAGAKSSAVSTYEALLPIVQRYIDEGSANARVFMGDMYRNGLGVGQDIVKAIEMYTGPADAGNAHAQMMLGEIFETSAEVKDEAHAAAYYAKAAENGIVEAAMRIGDMCREGRGVGGRKLEDAYMWYYLAQLQGEARGRTQIEELEGRGLLNLKSVNSATARRARERALQIYEALPGGE